VVEAECEKARTLDPASTCGLLEGNLAAVRGNLGDALALWEQAAANDPLNTFVLGSLAFGYYSAGQFSEAEANALKVTELLGERDQAFSWLERANQRHDSELVGIPPITVDPDIKSLRGDSRYKALLRKMNLPN
jgi:tetratricopeptide (TPR) repeat protein